MCGLNGAAGFINVREERAIKDHLIFSTVRGYDATGMASVRRNLVKNNRDIYLAKRIGPFPNLFDLKSFDTVFSGINCCYIGHNRAKTIGENTDRNAHPFKFDDIVGAHNGTIDWQNRGNLDKGHDFKTDSEAIFYNIQEHGIKETISRLEINSKSVAFALTWYDKREHTINFIRNEERPFVYCLVNEGKTLFWGSEYELMAAAIYRNEFKPVDNKVTFMNANTLHTFYIPPLPTEKFDSPEKKKLEGKKTYPFVTKKTGTLFRYGKNTDTGSNFNDDSLKDLPVYCGTRTPKQAIEEGVKLTSNINDGGRTILTGSSIMQKRMFEHAERGGIVPDNKKNRCLLIYSGKSLTDEDIKVWRFLDTKMWVTLRYDNTKGKEVWNRYETLKAPCDVPYTILGSGSHSFVHTGKKKNKKIFYKGYNGKRLDQDEFNHHMEAGCLNCERNPEWGNKVVWLSSQHDFLCEFCSMDEKMLNEYLEAGKQEKAA